MILETGLGGRLDATNIVTPLASVITNIGFDHQQWLGDTLEKIAAEKAGIIKPEIPVVTATNEPEALAVIEKIAREKNAPLKISTSERLAGTLAPSLLGEHQKLNARLALATVEVLQKQISVSADNIHAGLANVDWPGRLQLITQSGGQKILLDGAHNLDGAKALRAALESLLPLPAKRDEGRGEGQIEKTTSSPRPALPLGEKREKPAFIAGFLGDKDWRPMCEMLAPLAEKVFTVPVASQRTADAHELAAAFRTANPAAEVVACKNLAEAFNTSKDAAFIVVTGSLYLVGEALELLGHSPASTGERGLNEWSATR